MSISPEWIVGFTDGEGVFTVEIMKSTSRIGYTVLLRFQLSVHYKDREVLEQMRQILGVGEVLNRSMERLRRKGVKASDQCMYEVHSLESCNRLRAFFDKNSLQSSKKAAFEKWSKILDIIKLGEHITRGGLLKIAKLRDEMNPRAKNAKYRSYSFFVNEFRKSSKSLEEWR